MVAGLPSINRTILQCFPPDIRQNYLYVGDWSVLKKRTIDKYNIF